MSLSTGVNSLVQTGKVTGIDGNNYKTVKIGNQWWIAENLNVDHYRNGDPVTQVQDPEKWANLTTGAWCYYDNDPANGNKYGKLYNWYAVNDSRNIAPKGWHVPSNAEWQTLLDYLGGSSVAGGKLKETGTSHWNSHNTDATNESGFAALPGGYRSSGGGYYFIRSHAYFCSSTEYDSDHAWYRALDYNYSAVYCHYFNKRNGFSVRCVMDSTTTEKRN